MNKFLIWLASILGTILIIAVAGIVVYNNSPKFKNWVDGLKDKIEKSKDDEPTDEPKDENKTEVAGATVIFENNQLIVVIS